MTTYTVRGWLCIVINKSHFAQNSISGVFDLGVAEEKKLEDARWMYTVPPIWVFGKYFTLFMAEFTSHVEAVFITTQGEARYMVAGFDNP